MVQTVYPSCAGCVVVDPAEFKYVRWPITPLDNDRTTSPGAGAGVGAGVVGAGVVGAGVVGAGVVGAGVVGAGVSLGVVGAGVGAGVVGAGVVGAGVGTPYAIIV
jgi:hypothetical protein